MRRLKDRVDTLEFDAENIAGELIDIKQSLSYNGIPLDTKTGYYCHSCGSKDVEKFRGKVICFACDKIHTLTKVPYDKLVQQHNSLKEEVENLKTYKNDIYDAGVRLHNRIEKLEKLVTKLTKTKRKKK